MGKTKNNPLNDPEDSASSPKLSGRFMLNRQSFSDLRQFNDLQNRQVVTIDRQQLTADLGDGCRWLVVQAVANDRHSPTGQLWSAIYTDLFRPLSKSESEQIRLVIDANKLQEMIALVESVRQELEGQEAETYTLVRALGIDLQFIAKQIKTDN